jgi:hypothetical protein
MKKRFLLPLALLAWTGLSLAALAKEIPAQLPDPDNSPPATDKPVKVYILSGQSNMVGMGDINGPSTRWGKEVLDPVVSIYEGPYDPKADYDKLTALETKKLESFGGTDPTPFPLGGTAVLRGQMQLPDDGVYIFNPGYGPSQDNIMEIDGKEVYRKEANKDPVHVPFKMGKDTKYPFKITYLNDKANGLGWYVRTDIPGLLTTLVQKDGKFPHLVDDQGKWTVRNDVIYKGVISAVGQGPLTVGIQGNTIGPELQFGHVMGYYHDEPVLLIKSSIGNRSLAWDILPPGSKRYTVDGVTYAGYKDSPASWPEGSEPKPIDWYAGKQYDDYTASIHEVLNNFGTLFPEYKDQGYEIAGFVWWQGHKDGGSEVHASRYGENMASLIKAWRTEFKVPNAPWVIATVGFGGENMSEIYKKIAEQQLSVSGESGRFPEFKDNVRTVETRGFWRDVSVSPRNQDYHYNRNAETFMMVGDAMGRAMVELLPEPKSK